jgi:hypothetical protein
VALLREIARGNISAAMRHCYLQFLFWIFLLDAGSAAPPSRSYVFTGSVTQAECGMLPSRSFEIPPSLGRYGTQDRLAIACLPGKDGNYRLTMKFTLTDGAIPDTKTVARSYSFRWGAKVATGKTSTNHLTGEFTNNEDKCDRVLKMLQDRAAVPDSDAKVAWSGACYGDARWGTSM